MSERRTRILERLALAAAAGLWLVAAALLWRTSVPGDLHVVRLDEHAYFSARVLDRTAHFEGFLRFDWLLAALAKLGALVLLAWRAPRLASGLPVGRVGKGIVLGLLVLVVIWAVNLPFGLAREWWLRRYGISKTGYFDWITQPWLALQGEVAAVCLLIAVAMGLAGTRLGRRWWLGAAPVFAAVVASLSFASPFLVVGETHPARGRIAGAERILEARERTGDVRVDVENVHAETTAANAYALGLGPTERVVLWDTLTRRFPFGEVRVALAHELGHIAHNHLVKGIAWFALFALLLAFAVERATRRRGGMADPAAVPLAALVLVAAQLALAPVSNVISRRYEAEADWSALEATRDAQGAQDLFRRFTITDLAQPDPPTWDYVLLEDHPTVMQRIAMAESFARRESVPGRELSKSP